MTIIEFLRTKAASTNLRRFGLLIFLALSALLVLLGSWVLHLDRNIQARFSEKRFAPPVEFYAAPETIQRGAQAVAREAEGILARRHFRRRDFGTPIQPGDYSVWNGDECRSLLPSQLSDEAKQTLPSIKKCVAFRNKGAARDTLASDDVQIMGFDETEKAVLIISGGNMQEKEAAFFAPEMFAQYYGDTPILRNVVSLGTVPTQCLNALLAIEDAKFLEHHGFSFSGMARAFLSALQPGKRAVGGSTITQQLVKNYFLSDERTLRRKITELFMALLVERHISKDEILETYINLIYMGQNGPFQVRGFAAASEHYFSQPIDSLDLPQCALLAGVLNNPGMLNPFTAPDRALKRRAKVLDHMLELKMIDESAALAAKSAPLPQKPVRILSEPAPYFVQAIRRELQQMGIDEQEGLRVYTTLNPLAQETAHQAVRAGLDRLEGSFAHLKKLKSQGKNLEALFLAANPKTGAIEALVGGRGYLVSQFNRAVDSHRQVGSIMKPFVYLTALESSKPDGTPYSPTSPVADVETTHRYEGQKWTPHNYEGEFNGSVPMYFALKESLNAATANLGMSVGLNNVIDTAQRLGITSKLSPFPALTLGAFEITPLEVLQSYAALSQLGRKAPLTMILRVESLNGEELFRFNSEGEQVVAEDVASELVGIMKQTIISGTGRGIRLGGFTAPAAGKTGTTNDKKDAWFAGFTPHHVAVVWVGYDDNTSHNLTGASGAAPIWASYMKSFASRFPADDFPWPDSVVKKELSPDQQKALGVPEKGEGKVLEPVELIFKKGMDP